MAHDHDMWDMEQAIDKNDIVAVHEVINRDPDILTARTNYGGATWLHYAAWRGVPNVITIFLDRGVDINFPGYQQGDTPLECAASWGQVEAAQLLLERGARMDTVKSENNPLFAAIIGKSPEIVQMLLDRGIDASVRYSKDMDATAWALLRGEQKIARMIADHLAKGDRARTETILQEAANTASRHGPLKRIRIIPAEEYFE